LNNKATKKPRGSVDTNHLKALVFAPAYAQTLRPGRRKLRRSREGMKKAEPKGRKSRAEK